MVSGRTLVRSGVHSLDLAILQMVHIDVDAIWSG
jgi:hypothetical protein